MVRLQDLLKAIKNDPEFQQREPAQSKHDETPEEKRERAEVERLFSFIGRYVVLFQQMESELDQIILLVVGQDRWHISQSIIALLSNRDKIELVHSIVMSSALSCGNERQREWLVSFEEVLDEVRNESVRRNKIIHSLYLFDFMKIGAPPLRSKRRKKKGEIGFDQEYVDIKYIRKAAGKVAELCFDVGMLRKQLIHWHDDVITSKALARKAEK